MYFVWRKNYFGQMTAFKCRTIPTDGNGKPAHFGIAHQISETEFELPISQLAKLYPKPEEKDD